MMHPTSPTDAGYGGVDRALSSDQTHCILEKALSSWQGALRRVLIIPPDYTRFHSGAGELTVQLCQLLDGQAQVDMLPALGTHVAMRKSEIERMFPGPAPERFLVHHWRSDVVTLGEVPASFVEQVSLGRLNFPMAAQVNRVLVEGDYDLIISVGQVVPHEVVGLANHNKNIFVGVGGSDMLNKSHFLGAVHGMERMMGRADTPVRRVFDYAEDHFLSGMNILYALTVKSRDENGRLQLRGLYTGQGKEPFDRAAALSQQINLDLLERPIRKALVWLDPDEYKSTWLGNKAIYRLRMAMADDGELIVLAPGVQAFGEDPVNDALIARHGYHGTPHTLNLVERHEEMRQNLSVAAHLIHGSSEGRFRVTYAAGGLERTQVEAAGFAYATPSEIVERYVPNQLQRGWNMVHGEEVFYVDNPALGLWALKEHFPMGDGPNG